MKFKKITNVVIGLGLSLIIWEAVVLFSGYEASLLPSPVMVLAGINELIASGILFIHIKVSLLRFLAGYFVAVLSAILIGLVLGWFDKIWDIFDPIVQVLRPISPIAWLPFIVLLFGIGNMPAIVVIFIAAFFPVLLSTVAAVKKTDKTYLKVAKNFGIKQPFVLTKIIFPAAFPNIVTGLHLALGTAWVFLVSGEMVGAQSGLGYLIIDARNALRADLLLSGIITIGILGLCLDKLITLFEKWVGRIWGVAAEPGRD